MQDYFLTCVRCKRSDTFAGLLSNGVFICKDCRNKEKEGELIQAASRIKQIEKLYVNDNELSRNELRAFIFGIIDNMSDTEMRQLLKDLENWEKSKVEKRKYPRRSTFIDITYSSDQRRVFEDFIRNISAGGLYIETNLVTELDQTLTMTFSHPDTGDPIKILGKVARVDTGGIGIRFNKLLTGF